MRDAARRASAKPARGGRPNACFVVAAAEDLGEFARSADRVVVQFPWGTLLLGAIGRDARVLESLACALKHGARLSVLVSLTERDGVALPGEAELRAAYTAAGLRLVSIDRLDPAEARAVRSTWARRLGAGTRRDVLRIEATRQG